MGSGSSWRERMFRIFRQLWSSVQRHFLINVQLQNWPKKQAGHPTCVNCLISGPSWEWSCYLHLQIADVESKHSPSKDVQSWSLELMADSRPLLVDCIEMVSRKLRWTSDHHRRWNMVKGHLLPNPIILQIKLIWQWGFVCLFCFY